MNYFQNNLKVRTMLRSGFTLVELLLVMAIIGVLSSLALVVVNEAQYDAQVSSTRSRIAMLDQILRQRMDIAQEMRLPINPGDTRYINEGNLPPTLGNRRAARQLRRRLIADIIDIEMPRSYWDVGFHRLDDVEVRDFSFPSSQFSKWLANTNWVNGEALLFDLFDSGFMPSNAIRFLGDTAPDVDASQYPEGVAIDAIPLVFDSQDPESLEDTEFAKLTSASEYLYGILQTTQFNGISAVEAMGDRAFADTDNDGFTEVVDSWGNPIGFQFELYFETGERYRPVDAFGNDADALNAGLNETVVGVTGDPVSVNEMLDLENIKLRLVSTGGRSSASEATRELITN